jgi:hypothetical protein
VTTKRGVGPRAGLNTWVKVHVKVKFTLAEDTKAQTGSRGIALLLPSAPDAGGWPTQRTGSFNPGKRLGERKSVCSFRESNLEFSAVQSRGRCNYSD